VTELSVALFELDELLLEGELLLDELLLDELLLDGLELELLGLEDEPLLCEDSLWELSELFEPWAKREIVETERARGLNNCGMFAAEPVFGSVSIGMFSIPYEMWLRSPNFNVRNREGRGSASRGR
jgi:hypothetical protein